MDCATTGVIYLLHCDCESYYVGKTIRPLRVRLHEHIYAAKICDLLSPIGINRSVHHEYGSIQISFTALDLVQREMKWIFTLRATTPPHLNEAMSFKFFL